MKNTIKPPIAKKSCKELTSHNHTREDLYFWMNDRSNPDVMDYLKQENAYKEGAMKHTDKLQKDLFAEIKAKIKQEDQSVPYKKNGYFYYTRTERETEYFLLCRKKKSLKEMEEVLLDVNQLASGHSYYDLGGSSVSPDNKFLVFGADTVSRREYTLYVKNLETGEILKDQIPRTTGEAVWANDNRTIFYVLKDEVTLRSVKIMKHILGTSYKEDTEVYVENDETFSVSIYKTKSERYLIIESESTLTTECRYLDADKAHDQFAIVQPRERGLEYSVEHFKDHFYIRTNHNALNFKLVKTPVSETEKENWVDVVPHRKEIYLSDFDILRDFLVISEREEGIDNLRVMPWNGDEYLIEFKEEVYAVESDINLDFNTDKFRFSYTSLTTPDSIFEFNLKSKERELLKEQEILGGFDKHNYETKRIYARAEDGTQIPMSIVYRKGMQRNCKNPTLLYGYGSYGITIEPAFRLSILPLLDRGFIYAIAHIRGGQINGRKWYDDGKLMKKINTFNDFISCAEQLIKDEYTSSEFLFARGGSAGGLLLGACINMRPDLFKGILVHVPFVDVITTMLDDSIPLTTGEYDEWGNPNNEEAYKYMLQYSPYDNVQRMDYPAMLVTTGLHDSQVQYWEPAKWVAKLRDYKTDKNPLFFHINMDFGHGGASGRFEWIKETALEYAFMLDVLKSAGN